MSPHSVRLDRRMETTFSSVELELSLSALLWVGNRAVRLLNELNLWIIKHDPRRLRRSLTRDQNYYFIELRPSSEAVLSL